MSILEYMGEVVYSVKTVFYGGKDCILWGGKDLILNEMPFKLACQTQTARFSYIIE